MKFLHCVLDEKFIAGIYEIIEKTGTGEHEFICFNQFHQSVRYLTGPLAEKVRIFTSRRKFRKRLLAADYDVLFIHSLKAVDLKILPQIPSQIKVWWSSWGYDIYSNSQIWKNSSDLAPCRRFAPLTAALNAQRGFSLKKALKNLIMQCGFLLLSPERFFMSRKQFEKAVARIDYCSTVLPAEFEDLKKNPFFKAEFMSFTVPPPQWVCDNIRVQRAPTDKRNVLVGQAAAAAMNHLDAFELLRGKLPENADVIVPLSYGDKEYANIVERKGCELFGTHMQGLRKFMPLQEYMDLLYSCNSAIFYSYRQQALGNINLLLAFGKKVFLPRESCTWRFFREKGVRIFSLEEISAEELSTPLSKEEVENNRQHLTDYDFAAMIQTFQKNYEIIKNEVKHF